MSMRKSVTPIVDANARVYLWNNNNTEISVLFPILASSALIEVVARLVSLSFTGKKTLVALLCREVGGGLSGIPVPSREAVAVCQKRAGIVCVTVDYVDRRNLTLPKATATVHLSDGTITLTGDYSMVSEIIKRLSGK